MIEMGKKYMLQSDVGRMESERLIVEVLRTDLDQTLPVLFRVRHPEGSEWSYGYRSAEGHLVQPDGYWHHSHSLVEVKPEQWWYVYFPDNIEVPCMVHKPFDSKELAQADMERRGLRTEQCVFFKRPVL